MQKNIEETLRSCNSFGGCDDVKHKYVTIWKPFFTNSFVKTYQKVFTASTAVIKMNKIIRLNINERQLLWHLHVLPSKLTLSLQRNQFSLTGQFFPAWWPWRERDKKAFFFCLCVSATFYFMPSIGALSFCGKLSLWWCAVVMMRITIHQTRWMIRCDHHYSLEDSFFRRDDTVS